MSSEGSVSTSNSSRIRQFGLYRTIDARTEEFLRLSRKRQIKQGCVCAVISTAITVTVVIVILLIYEYAIAVESSLVQSKRRANRRNDIANLTNDTPVADRLDRSFFGFDQDYYERMPLLVNALQENSYVDPTIDNTLNKENYLKPPKPKQISNTNNYKTAQVRRTSPRPFYYEYRSPAPVPFSKTYRSKSWIESYRNAQRLKNIQQVIKYLESTINAKIGDMYTDPSSKHIAFTGVYLEPSVLQDKSPEVTAPGEDIDSSNKLETFKSNHQSDPLFEYKPESPGEVNLLADGFLRFSPVTGFGGRKDLQNVPMFRPIPSYKKRCQGIYCDNTKITDSIASYTGSEINNSSNYSKAKSFSVMLNLFPLKSNQENDAKKIEPHKTPVDKIYLTTSKPLILFKRKSNNVGRRRTIITKRPRTFLTKDHKSLLHDIEKHINTKERNNDSNPGSNMIVQINLYSDKKTETTTEIQNNTESYASTTPVNVAYNDHSTMNPYYNTPLRTTEVPFLLSTTQVEDFHIGSSGVIPIEARVPPSTTLPPPTLLPFFDVTLSSTESAWFTKPPDILKFSHEDAKIPEEYKRMRESDVYDNIYSDINRRNFRDSFEIEDLESRTLVTKLKNEMDNYDSTTPYSKTKERTETTSASQINGHYRSFNQNSKVLSRLLDPNSEMNRKRRLSLFAKGFRRANFDYVEIKRNSTTTESPDY